MMITLSAPLSIAWAAWAKSNCKASMAAQLWLADEIARVGGPKRGTVGFTFVGDEENLGPDGMAFLRESGRVKPDMLVLGAQTENQLITAERGVLWVAIETRGKAAHAGAPDKGDNAILRMLRVLAALERTLGERLPARRDGSMASTWRVNASKTSCPAPKRVANCSESRVQRSAIGTGISRTAPIDVDASWISQARLRSHSTANAEGRVELHAKRPWLRRMTAWRSPMLRTSLGPSSACTVMPSKSW